MEQRGCTNGRGGGEEVFARTGSTNIIAGDETTSVTNQTYLQLVTLLSHITHRFHLELSKCFSIYTFLTNAKTEATFENHHQRRHHG